MNQFELLDKEKHRSLRVVKERSAALGDGVMNVMTYPMEFRDVQSCYPILFTQDPANGAYFATAILGFKENENLFLVDDDWQATYIPIMVRRQPFMIARQESDHADAQAAVSIDMSHPRVSEERGEVLFQDDGEPSDFLATAIELLHKINQGIDQGQGFIKALMENDLLEAVTLDFTFIDGSKTSLQGFLTIKEEKLYQLEGNVLEQLNKAGYLQPIFMAVASLSNIRGLIERRNNLARAGSS